MTSLLAHLRNRRALGPLFLALIIVLAYVHLSGPHSTFSRSRGSSYDPVEHKVQARKRLDGQFRKRKWEPYTRVVAGVRGFWVFENVYVKDRILYMVPHPNSPPFPPMREIITQQIHDSYAYHPPSSSPGPSDSSRFPDIINYPLSAPGSAHTRYHASSNDALHIKPLQRLLSRDEESSSDFDRNNASLPDDLLSRFALRCENDDHPHIPRLHVLIPPVGKNEDEPVSRETYARRIVDARSGDKNGKEVAGLDLGVDIQSIIPAFGRDEMYRIGRNGDVRYEKNNAGNVLRKEGGVELGIWDRVLANHPPGGLESRLHTSWSTNIRNALGLPPSSDASYAPLDESHAIEILDGLTLYMADDPAITGWGSLMHHYFHFAGEVLVGSFRAAAQAVWSPFESVEELDDGLGEMERNMEMRRRREAGTPDDIKGSKAPKKMATNNTSNLPRRYPPGPFPHFPRLPNDALDTLMPFPERFIFPWNRNWEDRELQATILNEGFGHPELYGRERWREMSMDGRWRMFEMVVITDRHAAHSGGMSSETERWNKMALDMIEVSLPSDRPNYLTAVQLSLFHGLGTKSIPIARPADGRALREGVVKLVYVDRQDSDRRLSNQSNDDLNAILDGLSGKGSGSPGHRTVDVVVIRAQFEKMDIKAQLETVADADIILGIHGNGLTHLIWARPGGVIIELFPNGSFIRDYQTLSTAAGHEHMPIWHDRILPEDEWRAFPRETEPGKLHDGTDTTIDRKFIDHLLHDTISRMARPKHD